MVPWLSVVTTQMVVPNSPDAPLQEFEQGTNSSSYTSVDDGRISSGAYTVCTVSTIFLEVQGKPVLEFS